LVVDDVREDRVSRHHAAIACIIGITVAVRDGLGWLEPCDTWEMTR
jgi:hypothetical protein